MMWLIGAGLIGLYTILTIISFQIAFTANNIEERLDSIEQRLNEMEDEE